ncbi:hypothetical protein, partial [Streptomyces sp. XY533]|uniref:hypothetical protein n=1 Tax=Streptomyces sp. XY533 TaxID=1519481 RepID=UPI001F3AF725
SLVFVALCLVACAFWLLLAAFCLLPAACCLLPAVRCPLPAGCPLLVRCSPAVGGSARAVVFVPWASV